MDETEGVGRFAFSPSGQWIAFQSGELLQKIPINGGSANPILEGKIIRAIDWSDEDWILINTAYNSGEENGRLFRVSVNDGQTEAITTLQDREFSHRSPQLLPGGQSLLYQSVTSDQFDTGNIMAKHLPGGEPVTVVERGYAGRYVSSGHLLYMDQGSLFAAPFDLDSLTISGERRSMISRVGNGEIGDGHFSVSKNGTLIYVEKDMFKGHLFELRWMDSAGKDELLAPADKYGDFALSPDGEQLAYIVNQSGQKDLWVIDTEKGYPSRIRLTDDIANKTNPVWSPSGKSIVFTSDLDGAETLYWKHVDDLNPPERLLQVEYLRAQSWHPEGKYLLVVEEKPGKDTNIRVLNLNGNDEEGWSVGELTDVQSTRLNERHPQFSPDGKWIAYQLHENSTPQVYVLSFPWEGRGRGKRIAVIEGRTNWPHWSRTEQELIFGNRSIGRTGQIIRVKYAIEDGKFNYSPPVPWQGVNFYQTRAIRSFDLDSSKNRLLVRHQKESDEEREYESRQIVLVENFFEYLNDKLPTGGRTSP